MVFMCARFMEQRLGIILNKTGFTETCSNWMASSEINIVGDYMQCTREKDQEALTWVFPFLPYNKKGTNTDNQDRYHHK